MKLKEIISNDYFRLFVKREGRVVLGKHCSSLWLLWGVLTATFMAIAFSNASLGYLSYKMNDPFINWVDIKNNFAGNDFSRFEESLSNEDNMAEYHYKGYQTDKYWYTSFFSNDKNTRNLKCRYFADIDTPLVHAILNDDNVVSGHRVPDSVLDNTSFGVIITYDALYNKLGYTKEIPTYLYYHGYCDAEAADEFFVDIYHDHYAMVPVPVLAVVKRLPTNMDIIGTKFFYLQDLAHSLNLYERSYYTSFLYNVPDAVDVGKFVADLEQTVAQKTDLSFYTNADDSMPRLVGIGGGKFVSLYFDDDDEVDFLVNKQINDEMLARYAKSGVRRLYDYNEAEVIDDDNDFISVHFSDLDKIADFQEFAKSEFDIDIEMSQISAKENFNEVSVMANILSWTMIVFAIVCIILFIVNLLHSYFQKVKRNLGTFKAFGIGNYELISVYVLIMIAMILVAVVLSLATTWAVQELLPVFGVLKDGTFDYLSLWSSKTFYSVLVIVVASVYTVYAVMGKLLKATPGDLIYDR